MYTTIVVLINHKRPSITRDQLWSSHAIVAKSQTASRLFATRIVGSELFINMAERSTSTVFFRADFQNRFLPTSEEWALRI